MTTLQAVGQLGRRVVAFWRASTDAERTLLFFALMATLASGSRFADMVDWSHNLDTSVGLLAWFVVSCGLLLYSVLTTSERAAQHELTNARLQQLDPADRVVQDETTGARYAWCDRHGWSRVAED
jgi:hypothetical protein